MVLHGNREVICAGRKSPHFSEKKKTLQKIEKIVSALQNSGGGQLLLHIDGQRVGDRYLEHFDEFITRSFSDLIEDHQLYVDAYDRQWWNGENCTEFLLIKVERSFRITTVDFNTKVRNDIENTRPTSSVLATLLCRKDIQEVPEPNLQGLLEPQLMHENRKIELKSLRSENLNSSNVSDLVDYIWTGLKLKDNLTSFSKIIGGGSLFVGVSEESPSENYTYKTKTPRIEGFELPTDGDIVKELKKKIGDSVSVGEYRNIAGSGPVVSDAPSDLVKIELHRVDNTAPQKYVLEIAVRYFDGLVFYDKQGPRTYKLENNRTCRIGRDEWLNRLVENQVART